MSASRARAARAHRARPKRNSGSRKRRVTTVPNLRRPTTGIQVVAATPRPDAFTARHPVGPKHPAANRPEPSPRVSGARQFYATPSHSLRDMTTISRRALPERPASTRKQSTGAHDWECSATRTPARSQRRTLMPNGHEPSSAAGWRCTQTLSAPEQQRAPGRRSQSWMCDGLPAPHPQTAQHTPAPRPASSGTQLSAPGNGTTAGAGANLSRSSRRGRQTIRLVRLHRRTTLLRIRRRT